MAGSPLIDKGSVVEGVRVKHSDMGLSRTPSLIFTIQGGWWFQQTDQANYPDGGALHCRHRHRSGIWIRRHQPVLHTRV